MVFELKLRRPMAFGKGFDGWLLVAISYLFLELSFWYECVEKIWLRLTLSGSWFFCTDSLRLALIYARVKLSLS